MWRPYLATGTALAIALGVNALTRNGLWFFYTLIGSGLFLLLVGFVRLRWLKPPSSAVWAVGVVAALHYGGGSLSGLHQFGGPNGAYYVFPWWDNVVHVLGSAAVSVAAFVALRARLPHTSRALVATLAICLATLAGVLVELYEFAQFALLGTIDQGFYTNNMVDLYNNLLGAAAGVALYARVVDARPSAQAKTTPQPL